MLLRLPERTTVTRNNKQSAMSQILSLERSTSLLFFLSLSTFLYVCKTTTHALSRRKTRIWTFFCHCDNHACSYITSSRWELKPSPVWTLITTILLLTLQTRIQWVFQLRLRATLSAWRWKLERAGSRHHTRLLTSVACYCQKLHICNGGRKFSGRWRWYGAPRSWYWDSVDEEQWE